MRRRTLETSATVTGTGLFSGSPATVTIRPSSDGIAFVRADLDGTPSIPAHIDALSDEPAHPAFASMPARSTNLAHPSNPDARALTVEHVLSALAGLGITDATIETTGPELPIDDGSARCFTSAILEAGTREIEGSVEPIVLREAVTVEDGRGGSITAHPIPGDEPASYTYHLEYDDGSIPTQEASWTTDDDYASLVAPARTFCLEREAQAMHQLGLFRNLTEEDLLVIGPRGPIRNAYRFENECARHKLLDLIGDLSLAGRPIRSRVEATRSGHALNHELARRIAAIAG